MNAHRDYVYSGKELEVWDAPDEKTEPDWEGKLPPENDKGAECQCRDGRFFFFLTGQKTISIVRPVSNGQISTPGITDVSCKLNRWVLLQYEGQCVKKDDKFCGCDKSCSHYVVWKCEKNKNFPNNKESRNRWVVKRHYYSQCK